MKSSIGWALVLMMSCAGAAEVATVDSGTDRGLIRQCRAMSNRVDPMIGKALAKSVKRYELAYEFASTADEKLMAESSLLSMCAAASEGRMGEELPVPVAPPKTPEQIQAELDDVIAQAQQDQARIEQAQAEALERERQAEIAAAAARAEAERLAAEAAEQERQRKVAEAQAREEARRAAAEQAQREREEAERIRLAAEAERQAQEAEARRLAAEEKARQVAEFKRQEAEREAMRIAAEAARVAAAEEAARLERERLEQERIAEEASAAAEAARQQAAAQEAERIRLEQEQMAKEVAEARAQQPLVPAETRVSTAPVEGLRSVNEGAWKGRSMIRVLGTPPPTNRTVQQK